MGPLDQPQVHLCDQFDIYPMYCYYTAKSLIRANGVVEEYFKEL